MSGSVTGTDMRPNSDAAYNNSVSKIEETLAQFEQEHSIPEPPQKSADDFESTPEPDDVSESDDTKSDDSQELADDDDSTPVTDGDSDDSSDDSKEKPAIPDNYFRAAAHQGWTPERISKLYEVDPEGTVEFLKKVYEDTNNLNGQFAELGRRKIALEQAKVNVESKPQETKSELDLVKLREQYEDDPVGVMLEIIKTQSPKPQEQSVTQPVQSNQREEDMAIAQQLHTFFISKDLEVYRDFYGSPDKNNPYDWSKSTPGQNANRYAITQEADAIIAGYELQGKQISVREALEKAHLRVTAPITEQIVREQLVSQVKKRSKSLTLRPSQSQGVVASGGTGEKSEAKAIQTAQAGLNELKKKGL